MGTTYSVNQFDEVVPCYDGRTSNSTTDRRYTTDFEKQLLEEIKELKIELEEAKANPVENRVMPKIAERWQQNLPDPLKDEQHYDIILVTGEQINDVEYWAFGGGFKPNNKPNKSYVDYSEGTVEFYRIHIS